MKLLLGMSFLILAGCASYHKKELPPFDKEKICSYESLAYLNRTKTYNETAPNSAITAKVYSRIQPLIPAMQACYQKEIDRSSNYEEFHLCLIIGINKKSKIDFFEFSNRNLNLSSELQQCLNEIKSRMELSGFKNISIVQPIHMRAVK